MLKNNLNLNTFDTLPKLVLSKMAKGPYLIIHVALNFNMIFFNKIKECSFLVISCRPYYIKY